MAKDFFSCYKKRYDTSNGFATAADWKETFYKRMGNEEAANILNSNKAETPYSILGVSTSATQQEIKTAFRSLIMKWHPDKNPGNLDQAEEMSKKIIAAYTILIQ